MDILLNVVLPLSLAIIMLSLGVGLTPADFGRVLRRGKAFAIGALCQLLLVPAVAYGFVLALGITGELAVGIMLLSFCPGGVTSNILSKLARADVALSVTLTAVISLVSILTVPLLVAWAVTRFMGANAPEVSVASLAFAMFLITAVPVALGVGFRQMAPHAADWLEPKLSALATVLFVLIVIAAVAANWQLFVDNLASLGPALIGINLVLLVLGIVIAGLLGLRWIERKTISIEVGIQNGTLGITLAPLIMGVSDGFTAMALPSGVYGVTMYLCAIPFILWFRSR